MYRGNGFPEKQKPWVARKSRKLYFQYPWVAFDGFTVAAFETWEEAVAFALSLYVDEL